MYTYFKILADFGFEPTSVWKLTTSKGHYPHPTDIYDPMKNTVEQVTRVSLEE